MYGSSLRCVTSSPRFSSSAPIDAAARPLPSELTTPPVTNMYLVFLPRFTMAVPLLLTHQRRPRGAPARAPGPPACRSRTRDSAVSATRIRCPCSSARSCSSDSSASSRPGGSAANSWRNARGERVDAHVCARERARRPPARRCGMARAREVERVAAESVTTFTTCAPLELPSVERTGERRHLDAGRAIAATSASMASGSMSGSSPCRFTTTSGARREPPRRLGHPVGAGRAPARS